MKHLAYLESALVVAGILIVDIAFASENADLQEFDPAMKEKMKMAEAACAPGTAHQALEPLVGEWNVEVKTYNDKHVFEMHDPARGENSKVMEITYIRKGSSQG